MEWFKDILSSNCLFKASWLSFLTTTYYGYACQDASELYACIFIEYGCLTIQIEMVSHDKTAIRDPTIDLIANLKIHPFEGGIASILLTYTIIAEILAFLLHRFKDANLPISR